MKTIAAALFYLLLLSCAFPKFISAQNDSPDAHLNGILLDASGAGIAAARVTAQTEGSSGTHIFSASSNTDGAYVLTLPSGRYRVQISRASFISREFVFDFAPGERRKLDLKLELEPLSSSVVVTAQAEPAPAQETTAPLTIISRQEIDARQAVSLTDALLFAPGVAIGRTGSGGGTASVFLNGGNSNFTKVLVDGTPVNTPGGNIDFSNFTTDNLDKIEIVRGAESAIYGTDAVSGVIQVFTHRGTTRIPEGDIFAEGGSFSTGRGGAQISGIAGAFDYSGAAAYWQTAGQGINNDFLNRSQSGNLGYGFSDTNQVRLTLRNNDSDAGIPGQTLFEPPNFNSHQRYDQHVFSANLRWSFATGTHWKHALSTGESYTLQRNSDPTFGNSRFQYNRASLNAQTSYLRSSFAATAGYQYEVENASLPFLSVNHVRRNNQGGFLDFHYRPHSRISVNFGARAEANANFGTRVVPRAGASLALRYARGFWGDTRYRIFYGQGIKEPRFDQNYNDQFGDFGNPSLKPEASKNWSTGVEQNLANDRVKLSAEYFSNRFYDIVSFAFCLPLPPPSTGNTCGVSIPGAPPSFGYFFNTDRARTRGIILTAETKINSWLNAAGTYTHDDTRVLAAPNLQFDPVQKAGNHLLRRPVHSGSLTLNAAFRQLSVTLGAYFSGRRADSDFFYPPLHLTSNPGYARFDLATRYNFRRGFSIYAHATNIFDKSYQDALGYPALGRDIRVGVNYRFGGHN
ncbi:MAG TPA: TonB-dependent receptor [Candidatus Dormibacteraeota bacterium]|nr:TonB-dependent receptor [Candidatus Dormibacteraeota bacterium]